MKWYQQKGFVVLMLILFFPVGLVLLWTSPATRLSGRVVWTLLVALAVAIVLGRGAEDPVGSVASSGGLARNDDFGAQG